VKQPGLVRGAKATLFERLVEADPAITSGLDPLRVQDLRTLEDSVTAHLSRLFNTRSNWTGICSELAERTVLDFGVPDFHARGALDDEARKQLALVLRNRIEQFEPRLSDVYVSLLPDPKAPLSLIGAVHARLKYGVNHEPVTFPLFIESEGVRTGDE
jgi:type VI secretion system protein ImpF